MPHKLTSSITQIKKGKRRKCGNNACLGVNRNWFGGVSWYSVGGMNYFKTSIIKPFEKKKVL